MKCAITATGPDIDSAVDSRFGRAEHFVVCSTDDDTLEVVDNKQNYNAPQGAGIQSAQNIAAHSVDAVITGHCGPKAFKALHAAGIKIFTGASGTVAQAREKLKKGELHEIDGADVDGHW
ncbi:MAG: dinitrogenase iron-molybdenum cofactor biosynthesis protein [Chitinivibrionales bacterium]|nr:dinitrogenase iron-molybdenum cofactor biosynthesis protein [Chitinivibrionales bacterium]